MTPSKFRIIAEFEKTVEWLSTAYVNISLHMFFMSSSFGLSFIETFELLVKHIQSLYALGFFTIFFTKIGSVFLISLEILVKYGKNEILESHVAGKIFWKGVKSWFFIIFEKTYGSSIFILKFGNVFLIGDTEFKVKCFKVFEQLTDLGDKDKEEGKSSLSLLSLTSVSWMCLLKLLPELAK